VVLCVAARIRDAGAFDDDDAVAPRAGEFRDELGGFVPATPAPAPLMVTIGMLCELSGSLDPVGA
jgi:hypothetical protein